MVSTSNSHVDYETGLLLELILDIDSILSRHIDELSDDEAQAFGVFDHAEHITGLGFVVCQTYLSTVYGILGFRKADALNLGPRHSSGQSIAEIINHAANFWKHNSEWVLGSDSQRKKYIENSFELLGYPLETDYPLSGVLTELTSPEPAGFAAIGKKLEMWKNSVLISDKFD